MCQWQYFNSKVVSYNLNYPAVLAQYRRANVLPSEQFDTFKLSLAVTRWQPQAQLM